MFTITRVQNKHVSSTHPETAGNLHHVSEYPLGPLIDFYCVLSTASRSLHSPVLQQRSQDGECFISQGNKPLWVLNNSEMNWTSLFVAQTPDDCKTPSSCLDLQSQTKRDPWCLCCCTEGFRKNEWKEIFQSYETHSPLIKMYYHRQREALGRLRSDWDWCRWEVGWLPQKATHERI